MSAKILKFEKRPVLFHEQDEPDTVIKGTAICLTCKNEWEAIIPLGSIDIKCPKCKTNKGVLKDFIQFRENIHYRCHCGHCMFFLLESGRNQCIICGTLIEFNE